MIFFLPFVFFFSSLVTISTAPTANAQGLLDDVTCLLRGVLKQNCPAGAQAPTQPAPPEQSAPAPGGSNQAPAPSYTPPARGVAPTVPAPLNQEDLTLPEKLEQPKEVGDAIKQQRTRALASTLSGVSGSPHAGAILGQSNSVAPLEATQNGWVIFSVPWYWWLLLAAALAGIYYLIFNSIRRRKGKR